MANKTDEPLNSADRTETPLAFAYLIFTAVICGASVMVVEVLGSRVIGPVFGVGLFVWTSLISVTLIALAIGYAAGGALADKQTSPGWMYGLILAAGIFVILIPLAKPFVLKACLPLGLRLGSFASSSVLFGPSLILLGCVTPYIVKIAAKEMERIGKTVGFFYSISTLGSVLGTVLTGFVFIAYMSVSLIFTIVGGGLIAVAVFYFIFFRRKWAAALGLVALCFPAFAHGHNSAVMPDGTRVDLVYGLDSHYGQIKVVDYSFGSLHTREMVIDGLVQGGIDFNNGLPIYEYAYFMQFIPYSMNPRGENLLVIGLGAGVAPMWYERRGVKADVIEIDPDVVGIAKEYFGFKVSGDIIISDARSGLAASTKKYDYVILDVFNGDITPAHVLSVEAMRLIERRLTDNGILAVNFVGDVLDDTFITISVVKTLEKVFENVDIYPTFEPDDDNRFGNIVMIAHNGPPVLPDHEIIKKFRVHRMAKVDIGKKLRFADTADFMILTDDFNPIDFHDRKLREEVRKRIIETTHWKILF